MQGISFFILDTETTGLQVGYAEISEISIIRFNDRFQLSRQVRVDKPQNASLDALKITRKTFEDLKKGVSKAEAIADVNNFLNSDGLTPSHRCIVAHNASFDKRFIHHMWEKAGTPFPADLWLDTIPMSKKLAAQMGQPKAKMKLGSVIELFNLKKIADAHTAKGDSRATYYLFKHLMEKNIDYLDLIKSVPHLRNDIEEESEDE